MTHLKNLSLRDADAAALDFARQLQAGLSGLRLDEEGGDGGEGAGGDGGDGGEGSGGQEGSDGSEGGEHTPLEQQALDAIQALKAAGTEIPEALNAVVKEFRDARKEAGNHRTAKTAEKERADAAEQQLAQVLEVLGIKPDGDAPPDVEQLKATIGDRDGELRAKTVEFDAFRAAGKFTDPKLAPHGVNPDALLDSRTFLAKAATLDPTSDSYTADLESAIKTAVESNPLLAASPGGGRRGPFQGPGPTPTPQPAGTLEDAFGQHYAQGG